MSEANTNSLLASNYSSAGAASFFGSDLPQDQADDLLASRWDDKQRARENALFASKDWDERVYHPVIATYHWCDLFTAETRALIRAHVDDTPPKVLASGKVVDWNPLPRDIMHSPADPKRFKNWRRKLGSVIRARQWADAHGMPYRFQIRRALKRIYFGRLDLLQRVKLPDPALLNGAELRDHVLLAWAEQLEAAIQYGSHPRYLLANGVKHPDIGKHQVWILSQAKRRAQPHFALAKFIRMGLLDPRLARLAFPAQIDRALALCR